MGKVCIRCGYERKEKELAPDTDCPSCGIIYERAENPANRPLSVQETNTPYGRARIARRKGRKLFQIDIALSQTTGHSSLLLGTFTSGGATDDASEILESIEAEGWHLIDANYVFRPIGTAGREKILGTTEHEAITGQIIGIYLFRANEEPKKATP